MDPRGPTWAALPPGGAGGGARSPCVPAHLGLAVMPMPGHVSPQPGGGPPPPFMGGGVPPPFPATVGTGPPPGANFLSLFGSSDMSLQEIADKAQQLQQKMDENAEHEKASLRAAAEQKYLEIERHAAELIRHASSSIEAYKTSQLQAAERQKAYEQAVVRQQAEHAKNLIDQQAAQAIAAVETRDRQQDLQRQQRELSQDPPPAFYSPMGARREVPSSCMPMVPPHMQTGPPPYPAAVGSGPPMQATMMAHPSTPPQPGRPLTEAVPRPMVPSAPVACGSRPTLHAPTSAVPPPILNREPDRYNVGVPRPLSPDTRQFPAACSRPLSPDSRYPVTPDIRHCSPSMPSRVLTYTEHIPTSDAEAALAASRSSAARTLSPGTATKSPTYIEPVTYSSSALTALTAAAGPAMGVASGLDARPLSPCPAMQRPGKAY